jgi:hypothetical protein
VVRYTLIEMVWRMTRWQPDYPPIKKLRSMISKRDNGGSSSLLLGAWQSTVALGHGPSHGSRTWSATPINYDSETKRLTLQQTPIWERRVYGFSIGR